MVKKNVVDSLPNPSGHPAATFSALFSVSQAGYIFGTILTFFRSLVIAHDRQLCRALGFWVNSCREDKNFDVGASSDKVTLSIPLSLTFTQIRVQGLIDN